jgi:Uma2 family endonuclease
MLKTLQTDSPDKQAELPRLEAGDHLSQPAFHELYSAMPPKFRAELIEGVVIVPSPLLTDHARLHSLVMAWLVQYDCATPGTWSLDNTSLLLPPDAEVQPDASLLIEPACGGQSHQECGYLASAPELIVEVASSSVSYDLHSKFRLYEQAGVKEYIVVVLREEQVRWFAANEQGKLAEVAADDDGIFRSRVFPGLWLNANALLFDRGADLLAMLQAGLATPEHAAFVASLRAKRGG